jgi:Rps23 Pro-64 3,4-dihydroxylase Tpa1-like proline 4-hydroxylase
MEEQQFSLIKEIPDTLQNEKSLKAQEYHEDRDIIHFKNVLKAEDCKYIVDICEKYFNWDRATTFGGLEGYRKTGMIPLTGVYGFNPDVFKAHSLLAYWFKVTFDEFRKYYTYQGHNGLASHVHYEGDEGFQILKYEPGNFYKEHVDTGMDLKRKYSTIMYLNDDYDGGETLFPRSGVSVKGSVGDVVYFSSSYTHPHIAQKIKEGIKYAAVIWSF